MKYKLINVENKQKTFCDKVTIDGLDYYVNDNAIGYKYGVSKLNEVVEIKIRYNATLYKGIICSNNPNMDIPQVVDEVDYLACEWVFNINGKKWSNIDDTAGDNFGSFKAGYNKSKETHPFSADDMIEFAEWIANCKLHGYSKQLYEAMIKYKVSTTKEVLQIWQEQRPKIIYYKKQG